MARSWGVCVPWGRGGVGHASRSWGGDGLAPERFEVSSGSSPHFAFCCRRRPDGSSSMTVWGAGGGSRTQNGVWRRGVKVLIVNFGLGRWVQLGGFGGGLRGGRAGVRGRCGVFAPTTAGPYAAAPMVSPRLPGSAGGGSGASSHRGETPFAAAPSPPPPPPLRPPPKPPHGHLDGSAFPELTACFKGVRIAVPGWDHKCRSWPGDGQHFHEGCGVCSAAPPGLGAALGVRRAGSWGRRPAAVWLELAGFLALVPEVPQ